jgi:hypothetical protein
VQEGLTIAEEFSYSLVTAQAKFRPRTVQLRPVENKVFLQILLIYFASHYPCNAHLSYPYHEELFTIGPLKGSMPKESLPLHSYLYIITRI